MELAKLNAVMEKAKNDLESGLIASGIWGEDGQELVEYISKDANVKPATASAMFNEVTEAINSSLKTSGFPRLNKYYFMNLQGNNSVMVMQADKYQMGMALDMGTLQMGILMSVIAPEIYAMFQDAVK